MSKLGSFIRRLSGKGGSENKEEIEMLNVGDQAPDFEVTSHDGSTVKLSDYKGKKVILWFYPKADTPG